MNATPTPPPAPSPDRGAGHVGVLERLRVECLRVASEHVEIAGIKRFCGECPDSYDDFASKLTADADALTAAIEALRAAEWQPIATAPKDAVVLLIWSAAWGGLRLGWRYGDGSFRESWNDPNEATHWRPLPSAPTPEPLP